MPRIVALALASLLIVCGAPHAAPAAKPPKLAVILVVDQMRADYVERFKADWTGGLKRLVTRGAWFRRAAYPYLTTVTCAGHATVSTGAFPHTHGVIQNGWWDRDARKVMTCTEDPRMTDVGYTGSVTGGDSAYRLLVPSFADQMRSQRAARVVTLSLKDRSAIMLAGHGGDAVTWLSNTLGTGANRSPSSTWETSSAFTKAPIAAVKAFLDGNPIEADSGKTWSRLLPDASYPEPDDGLGERAPAGWTTTFPHVLKSRSGAPDAEFFQQWQLTPYADEYLGRLAAALVEQLQLGKREASDVLSISFSTLDLVGHSFGPESQEVHDILAHLDRTIGTLLDRLDAFVGRGEYVVALTADHGVTPIPEQLAAHGRDGGRINLPDLIDRIQKRVEASIGPGKHVAALNGNDLYLEPGVYTKLAASPAALDAVMDAILATPGIQRVFRSEQVREGAKAPDALLRAAALGYFPGRSGDLIVALKPGWIVGTNAATHGSANPDDQRVPILLMGRGIKPGQYLRAATPADIAPTLAAVCGITMPKAEGRALREALTAVPNLTRTVVSQPVGR